jgi:uncharacterized protein (DUF433 family)
MDMNTVIANKDILGGVPCFAGTRVPVAALFDYIEQGHTVPEFLDDFPSVAPAQALSVLETAKADVQSHAEQIGTA